MAGLIDITAGQSVSNAVLFPGAGLLGAGAGAMSIGYGGQGEALTYSTQATFTLAQSLNGGFKINLGDYIFSSSGFGSSELDIAVNGVVHCYSFTTLAQAEAFFDDQTLDYGTILGLNNVTIDYSLASSMIGDGFGFDYSLAYAPAPAPEAGRGLLSLAALVLAGALVRPRLRQARE